MCGLAAAMAGTMALTSAAGQYQSYQAAEAQADYQNKVYEQNRRDSYAALARQYTDMGTQQLQQQEAAAQQKEDIARQARAQMASSRVAAGEAGISGISVNLGLRDISGAASRDRVNVDQNLQWSLADIQRQKLSAQTGAVNQINSVSKGQRPSKAALGIGLANSTAASYMQYESVKPKA